MAKRSRLDEGADALTRADAALTRSARPAREASGFAAVAAIGKLGDQPPLRALCAVTFLAAIAARSPRLARAGLGMIAAHEVATLAKDLVKERIDRTRPKSAQSHRERRPRAGRSQSSDLRSFPSGHSAGAMAVAQAFAREFPEYRLPALAAAVAVAAVQVPRLTHYASDVVAGLALGAAAEAATGLLLDAVPSALPDAAAEAS